MDLEKIVALGCQLGLSGGELRKWVAQKEKDEKEKAEKAREEAERARQAAREESERAERERENEFQRQLQLERAKAEREEKARNGEIEKLKTEIEALRLERDSTSADRSIREENNGVRLNPSKLLVAFDEKKDDLDAYIRRFEGIARSQNWPEDQWSTALSARLSGEALNVFGRLTPEDAADYSKVKAALLKRFRFTVDGFREKFRSETPADGETATQFAARLSHYFDRWTELAEIEKEYASLRELLIKEQFLNGCHPSLSLYLKERRAKSLAEMLELADQYFEAQRSTNLGRAKREKREDSGRLEPEKRSAGQKPPPKCYLCNKVGHHANNCRSNFTGNNAPKCFKCGRHGHKADVCRSNNKVPQVSCVYAPPKQPKPDDISEGFVELKNGKKIPVVNAVTMTGSEFRGERMPVAQGKLADREVSVLRDTGCSVVIVREDLVRDEDLTGETSPVYLADGTIRKLPEAQIEVQTPYYSGRVNALCMKTPLYDLILGNINGVRAPDDPIASPTQEEIPPDTIKPQVMYEPHPDDSAEREVAAAVTRAQSKKKARRFQPLKTPAPTSEPPQECSYAEEQERDHSLKSCFAQIGKETKNSKSKHKIEFKLEGSLLYRRFTEKTGREVRQLVVPIGRRQTVLKTAHDGIMAGHLGVEKTKDRILEDFFWPGITADVKRFVASCDICQRTIPKGRVPRVPLGRTPVIETPFHRVAIDIVGPINPPSKAGNRFILTLMDCATRYPDAIALPSIETERVAEALVEMFSRVGVPKEVLSDRGTNFTSELMKEVARLLSVRQLHTSPYHPMANGMVEKFNGTLKLMLKRMCAEKPRDWDRYLAPLLFAYREVPQASLGFSPFELLYGRHIRGPLSILKEIWSNESLDEEIKTTYQHVLDLRNRLEETCRVAHEELEKAGARYAKLYNRKTRNRRFQTGDQVLVLLPTDNNKLLLHWKGPFEVKERKGEADYVIETPSGPKVFHANLLKKYEERKPNPEKTVCNAICGVSEPSEESGIPVPDFVKTEGIADVKLSPHLTTTQKAQIEAELKQHSKIFSNVPGKTNLVECHLELTTDTPVHVKQYPLPFATVENVEKEVQDMKALEIIEESVSPYNSPVLLVKKPDHTNRFVVDYRKLNNILVADSEPMPRADAVFAAAGGKRYFSKLDFVKGYWQIPLSEESKAKTAFSTTSGLYQFRYMPFGIKTAPAVFAKLMRRIVNGVPGVNHYYDDVLIASNTWEEHVASLRELFSRIEAAGLTVRPSKCEFGTAEIDFLGHRIGQGELAPLGKNLEKIQTVPAPKTKRQVRAFLGLTGYYRGFIPNYAEISAPLTALTKKGENNIVKWSTAQEEAFQELKRRISSPPILRLPDFTKTFVLRTDASQTSLGAVLMQRYEGTLHPIAYASRKLVPREVCYSTIERECLALVWGVQKFNMYLYGRPFVVQTDHQPLRYIQQAKQLNSRVLRWSLLLQEYQFTVEHIKGSENVGADYLSRV